MRGIGDEAAAFVRRSKVVLVATRSPASRPFMTPLWFVVHRGTIYVTTGTRSWAGRNVAQHPGITLLFGGERGTGAERVLRLRGRAVCEAGLPPWPVLLRVAAKYYLAPRALLVELRHLAQWRLRQRYYRASAGGAGHVKVIPTSAEFLLRP